jgi:putative hemolysin
LVDGSTSVSDVNEELDIDIPDDEWDSVGGFLFGTLEHVPAIGESIDYDGWRFTAVEVKGRRIRKIRIGLVDGVHTMDSVVVNPS